MSLKWLWKRLVVSSLIGLATSLHVERERKFWRKVSKQAKLLLSIFSCPDIIILCRVSASAAAAASAWPVFESITYFCFSFLRSPSATTTKMASYKFAALVAVVFVSVVINIESKFQKRPWFLKTVGRTVPRELEVQFEVTQVEFHALKFSLAWPQ